MAYYVAPHQPEHLFYRKSKNEREARYIAAQELACLVNDKSLDLKMPNGFSTRQLLAIKGLYFKPGNLLSERDWDDVLFETDAPVEVRPYAQRPNQINQETHNQTSAEPQSCHRVV